MGDSEGADLEERVLAAVSDADVGADDLFSNLADLEAVEVDVAGSVAHLTVTIPVPASTIRDRLADGLRAAVSGVDGVETVEVAWRPNVADPGLRVDVLPDVKNVVAVSSGKGGVGKSTVAANLAVALADAGASVGLLDADVYGPNAPSMLGLGDGSPATTPDARIVPREAHGVRVMSMDFVVDEDDPIIWRGPMVNDVLMQLTGDVEWGELDYLLVDMPPGTGDAQLTLVQYLPVAGAVVVTTPQSVAVDDARRGLRAFARYDVPILGIVENMSDFRCPDCGAVHEIFGDGGAAGLAEEFEVPVLGRLPLDPAVGTLSEEERSRAVSIPMVGRIGLPRTREEREGRLPPVALRDGAESRLAARETATRVAARVNAAAVVDWQPPG